MSSYAVSKTSGGSEARPLVATSKYDNKLNATARKHKDNTQSAPAADESKKNLPTTYQKKNISVVGASQLLSHKYPREYSSKNYQKALAELKLVLIGIGSFVFLVYMGWAAVLQINFTKGGGFVYNSGLIGGSLMLVALVYAACKRVKSLRRFVTTNTWYYIHIACGAIGAYLVVLHSSFDLRSINASVALVTTLLVIVSGALGRYLFTLSTIVLHRQYVEIKDTEKSLFELIDKYDHDRSLRIRKRLSKFAFHCFKKPESRLVYFSRWVSIIYYGIYFYLVSRRDIKKIGKKMLAMTRLTNLTRKDTKILKRYKKRKLKQYVFQIVKMGYVSLVEQVLRHWRILHIPALYLLTLTAIVHVIVVHMY